ncbi:MAG: TIGR00270 family protein [Thermoplasmata archaeon]|nr:TIGR00270 family protein [Thermoplasmata archaeon]
MICELCGKDVPVLNPIVIEGTTLNVCRECARFGTAAGEGKRASSGGRGSLEERLERRERRLRERDVFGEDEYVLAEDYPQRIRRGRERLGLSQEELATKLAEKKSVIAKLEKGDIRPDNALIKKIEHHLSISLRERVREALTPGRRGSRPLTLGDLIKMELDKKKREGS